MGTSSPDVTLESALSRAGHFYVVRAGMAGMSGDDERNRAFRHPSPVSSQWSVDISFQADRGAEHSHIILHPINPTRTIRPSGRQVQIPRSTIHPSEIEREGGGQRQTEGKVDRPVRVGGWEGGLRACFFV